MVSYNKTSKVDNVHIHEIIHTGMCTQNYIYHYTRKAKVVKPRLLFNYSPFQYEYKDTDKTEKTLALIRHSMNDEMD